MAGLRRLAVDAPMGDRLRLAYQAYSELAKVRLSAMVVITTGVGFILASHHGVDWARLFWTCLGTFLAAVGASGFNQLWEMRRDALMKRTSGRPLPMRIISRGHAFAFSFFACTAGVAILCPTSYWQTAVLGLANILIYVLIYTPMKPLTSFNTLVGAVVGGIPPVMGWVAAGGSFGWGALLLGGVLFVWQIPHFLALAWMYKDDYAAGGYRMLPAYDVSGRATANASLAWSMLLVPLGLGLTYLHVTGVVFAVVSTVLGIGLMLLVGAFAMERSRANARRVFLASIIYLPVLLIAMVMDKGTGVAGQTLPVDSAAIIYER